MLWLALVLVKLNKCTDLEAAKLLTCYSLLFTRWLLVVTQYLLLFTSYSLRYNLYCLHFTCCWLLFTFYLLIVTFYLHLFHFTCYTLEDQRQAVRERIIRKFYPQSSSSICIHHFQPV